MKKFILFTLLAVTSTFTFAKPQPFIGADYGVIYGNNNASYNAAYLKFGQQGEVFGVEARLGKGTEEHQGNKLDNSFGVYLKMQASDTSLKPYLVLGYTNMKASNADHSITTVHDISYGVGAAYSVTDNLSLTSEFIAYSSKFAVDTSGFNLGISYSL